MKLSKKELKQIADDSMYKIFREGESCVTNKEKKSYNNAIMGLADKLAEYCID